MLNNKKLMYASLLFALLGFVFQITTYAQTAKFKQMDDELGLVSMEAEN